MTAEHLLRSKNAAPFRPFQIFLADGRSVDIQHPDFISVSAEDELAHVFDLNDGAESIDLMLVVSLKVAAIRAER